MYEQVSFSECNVRIQSLSYSASVFVSSMSFFEEKLMRGGQGANRHGGNYTSESPNRSSRSIRFKHLQYRQKRAGWNHLLNVLTSRLCTHAPTPWG